MCSIAYSYMGWRRTSPMSASCSWYYPTHHISHDGAVYPDSSYAYHIFPRLIHFLPGGQEAWFEGKGVFIFLSFFPSLPHFLLSVCYVYAVWCLWYTHVWMQVYMLRCKESCLSVSIIFYYRTKPGDRLVEIRAHQTKPWYHQSTQSHM